MTEPCLESLLSTIPPATTALPFSNDHDGAETGGQNWAAPSFADKVTTRAFSSLRQAAARAARQRHMSACQILQLVARVAARLFLGEIATQMMRSAPETL